MFHTTLIFLKRFLCMYVCVCVDYQVVGTSRPLIFIQTVTMNKYWKIFCCLYYLRHIEGICYPSHENNRKKCFFPRWVVFGWTSNRIKNYFKSFLCLIFMTCKLAGSLLHIESIVFVCSNTCGLWGEFRQFSSNQQKKSLAPDIIDLNV